MHTMVTHTLQLRGGVTIAVHHAARAFQADNHFILLRYRHGQYGGNFMAQQLGFTGLNVAVEIEYKHALTRGVVWLAVFYPFFIRFFFFFVFFLTLFIQLLQFGFAVQGDFQILFKVFQLVVNLFNHQFAFIATFMAAAQ